MPPNELLSVDPAAFDAHFNRRPFYVRAEVTNHPLFGLDAIAQLASVLPGEYVESNLADLPVGARPEDIRRPFDAPAETVRRIGENGAWMVLKRVEQDPRYAALMHACLDLLTPHVRRAGLQMKNRQAFLFVSSPNAVTPLHMDPEHNFLLQIRGTKTVHMWNPDDRQVVSEQDLETFHAAFVHRNLPYRDEFAAASYRLELAPGQGLHFPVTVPHWVKNGPEVSVSFSITFRSDFSDRLARTYRANARLRRLGPHAAAGGCFAGDRSGQEHGSRGVGARQTPRQKVTFRP